jgi:hypothetical protein
VNLGHWIPVVPYRRKPYLEPGQVTKIHEYHSFCCTSMVLRQLFKVLSPLLVLCTSPYPARQAMVLWGGPPSWRSKGRLFDHMSRGS